MMAFTFTGQLMAVCAFCVLIFVAFLVDAPLRGKENECNIPFFQQTLPFVYEASCLSQKRFSFTILQREMKIQDQLQKINLLQQTQHPLHQPRERDLCLCCFYTTDQLKPVNETLWVSVVLRAGGAARAEGRLEPARTVTHTNTLSSGETPGPPDSSSWFSKRKGPSSAVIVDSGLLCR